MPEIIFSKKEIFIQISFSGTALISVFVFNFSSSADVNSFNKRKQTKWRPSKISEKDTRHILETLRELQKNEGLFTTPRIAWESGLSG